jgi:hypothetical protein
VRKFILGFGSSALACTRKVGPFFAKSCSIPTQALFTNFKIFGMVDVEVVVVIETKKNSKYVSWAYLKTYFLVLFLSVNSVSCLEGSQSTPSGRVPLRLPQPEPKSTDVLRSIKYNIVEASLMSSSRSSAGAMGASPKSILSNALLKAIVAAKGVPRFQIKEILDELLVDGGTACSGASCRQIFGIKPEEVDAYLDELYLTVKKSTAMRDAEYASQYGWLVGSLKKSDQTAWNRPTVDGVSYLPNGEIDRTEGVGAFMDLPLEKATRNLDVGGGAHESNTNYLATRGVANYVYDPYARSEGHNQRILQIVRSSPVDSVTSMSILNVIDDSAARLAHIHLCKKSLKSGGKAYFKVWAGNGSGKGDYILGGYQSNRDAKSYIQDVRQVFGERQVTYDENLRVLVAVNQEP